MSSPRQQPADAGMDSSTIEAQTMLVMEEKLVVTTENVETGRILVSKQVFQQEATFTGEITSEELIVERKEINEYVQTAPAAVRQEGGRNHCLGCKGGIGCRKTPDACRRDAYHKASSPRSKDLYRNAAKGRSNHFKKRSWHRYLIAGRNSTN